MPTPNTRAKRWVFTCNNYTDEDVEHVNDMQEKCKWAVIGREVGKNGTPHLQGFVSFKKQVYFRQVAAMVPFAHWEMAKGTDEDNWNYCTKEGDFFTLGEAPVFSNSKRARKETDWEQVRSLAMDNQLHLIDAEPYIKFYPSLRRIAQDNPIKLATLEGELEHLWIWGPPGTGKSRFARWVTNDEAYIKNCNKWWCGYKGQEDVIIDDFDKTHAVLAHHLKVWADRYPVNAENKGGGGMARPRRIILTSNYSPEEIGWDAVTLAAIKRRFQEVNFMEPQTVEDFANTCETYNIRQITDDVSSVLEELPNPHQEIQTEFSDATSGSESGLSDKENAYLEEEEMLATQALNEIRNNEIIEDD